MSTDLGTKMDSGFLSLYSNYQQLEEGGWQKGMWRHAALRQKTSSVPVSLQYREGDLSKIEALGFQTTFVEREGLADGIIQLSDVPRLMEEEAVLKLSYGTEMDLFLETSSIEIEARKTSGSSQFVWELNNLGNFSGSTGKSVIIGVIDTGIDWRHHSFLEATQPKSRILRIWDQGLQKEASNNEDHPPANLLSGNTRYGVEYKKALIDQVLVGTKPLSAIRHRDCNGHGTHVAGIAAGNGRQKALSNSPAFEFAGVAPEAKLIVVKLLHLSHEPAGVTFLRRFKDAITYVLEAAKAEDPSAPVVINCSFGNSFGAHDGLPREGADGQEVFLENTFANATGKICVFAAGNSAGQRTHAIATIPASGEVEIPLQLSDGRTFKQNFNLCRYESSTRPLHLEMWYPKLTTGDVQVAFKVPNESSFSRNVLLDGPPLQNRRFDTNKFFSISHNKRVTKRNGADVERNNILITITPRGDDFLPGAYTVRLRGPEGTKVHLWCINGRGFGCKMGTVPASGAIDVTDLNTLGSPGSTPSVITVTAYNDVNDHMACFSSAGPLLDFSGLGPIADKPDIAAPGEKVFSNRSYAARADINRIQNYFINNTLGFHYVSKSGTSMAAPHIAGVVALMLEKKTNATVADIKAALKDPTAVRTMPKDQADDEKNCAISSSHANPLATAPRAGAGKVSAKGAVDKI